MNTHTTTERISTMKLIAHNQLVGCSNGFALFRDLFEDENGKRTSVNTSSVFEIQKDRTLPDGRLTKYASTEQIFNKHRLKQTDLTSQT